MITTFCLLCSEYLNQNIQFDIIVDPYMLSMYKQIYQLIEIAIDLTVLVVLTILNMCCIGLDIF